MVVFRQNIRLTFARFLWGAMATISAVAPSTTRRRSSPPRTAAISSSRVGIRGKHWMPLLQDFAIKYLSMVVRNGVNLQLEQPKTKLMCWLKNATNKTSWHFLCSSTVLRRWGPWRLQRHWRVLLHLQVVQSGRAGIEWYKWYFLHSVSRSKRLNSSFCDVPKPSCLKPVFWVTILWSVLSGTPLKWI